MPVYRNSTELGDTDLKQGDVVIFDIPEGKIFDQPVSACSVIYNVTKYDGDVYLKGVDIPNHAVFVKLGIAEKRHLIADLLVGKAKSDTSKNWPLHGTWTETDHTKIVRGLFLHIEGKKNMLEAALALEVIRKAEAEKAFSDLQEKVKDILPVATALREGDWGCQRSNVYNLVAALLDITREQLDTALACIEPPSRYL